MRYRKKEIPCEIIFSENDLKALEYIKLYEEYLEREEEAEKIDDDT